MQILGGKVKLLQSRSGDLSEGTKYLTNLIDGSVIDIQAISGTLDIELKSYEAKVFYLGDEPVGC